MRKVWVEHICGHDEKHELGKGWQARKQSLSRGRCSDCRGHRKVNVTHSCGCIVKYVLGEGWQATKKALQSRFCHGCKKRGNFYASSLRPLQNKLIMAAYGPEHLEYGSMRVWEED